MIHAIKLVNLTTKESINLDKPGHDYTLLHKDFGTALGTHNTTKYINLVGSHYNTTSINDRAIELVGCILTSSPEKMQRLKQKLNRLINPRDHIIAYYKDYSITFNPNSSIKYSTNRYENTDSYCKFMIQGTAFEPAFKRIKEEISYSSMANKVPLFPMKIHKKYGICFGKIADITTKNVYNDGDIETGFICRLKADKGDIVNPKIVNNLTGKCIELAIRLQKDDVVEISTQSGNKYVKFIRGGVETDIMKQMTRKSSMSMQLNKGYNDITISAAKNGGNLSRIIKFTPLYLEVE